MKQINVLVWKKFEISRLFLIKSPAARTIGTYEKGDTSYVSSGGSNNGVVSYLEPKENESLEKGNCISISPLEGTPCFYQEVDFLGRGGAGSAISLLYNENLNKFCALFICEVIRVSAKKFDYADAFTSENLRHLLIKLPIKHDDCGNEVIDRKLNYNDDGNIPDWNFMSEYMLKIQPEAQFKINTLKTVKGNRTSIDFSNWKDFFVKDLFITVKKGKSLQVPTGASVPSKELNEGTYPKISVAGINNGIVGYYSSDNKNLRLYDNFISVSFLGTVFYQPNSAFLDMKVHCLKPKNVILNRYTGLFLVAIIKEAIKKYTYGDQISSTLLPNVKIKLPISGNGEIDWQYMKNMMETIEKKASGRISIFKESQ